MGRWESEAFHAVIRAGLTAYRLELALQWYHTIAQTTGEIGEHLGTHRKDLLREIYPRGIAPYEDPVVDRSARWNELHQRGKQRHRE